MAQIAKKIGISRSTLYRWCELESDIRDSLSCGHTGACVIVENSLFKKCTGYTERVKKVIKIKHIEYDDSGKRVKEWEEPTEVEEDYFVPADTNAIKFYLANRLPNIYRVNPTELPPGDTNENTGVVMLPEAEDANCPVKQS